MTQTPLEPATSGSRQTTAGGLARRQAILEAALRIVAREGIRAVRHRAVAAEAGVPLAATTYYFSSLQDLLSESFVHWIETNKGEVEMFKSAAGDLLQEAVAESSGLTTEKLVDAVSELTAQHVMRQVDEGEYNRNIELAFRHEALRDGRLRQLVLSQDRGMVDAIASFNRALGVEEPDAEAEIAMAVILRLEQQALIAGIQPDHIRMVLRRYFSRLR